MVARVRVHRGEYPAAIRAAQTALQVLVTDEDRQRRADVYESLGLARHASGDPVAGAADLERSAALRHELADEATWVGAERYYRDIARYADIGAAVAHAQAGDLDRAESVLRSVLDAIEPPSVDDLLSEVLTTRDGRIIPRPQPNETPGLHVPRTWIIATYRMGEIADARKDFDRARTLFDRALRATALLPQPESAVDRGHSPVGCRLRAAMPRRRGRIRACRRRPCDHRASDATGSSDDCRGSVTSRRSPSPAR